MSDNPLLKFSFSHEQTPRTTTYYVKNRFKRRQRPRRVTESVSAVPTVEQVADVNNLIATYYDMKARAGQAPGPDGVTYSDMGSREVAELMRELSRAVIGGSYRPGPTRRVPVPKLRGGTRTLAIGNVCDRVVAAALSKAMESVWERIFLNGSMGFRPNRGVWRLFVELEAVMAAQDSWVVAVDDVRKAFDNVNLDMAVAVHAKYIPDKLLTTLRAYPDNPAARYVMMAKAKWSMAI
jgi:hypothetical protein